MSILSGLISFWKFEEISGSRYDTGPAQNTLTEFNAPIARGAGEPGFGINLFRESGQYLYITHALQSGLSITGSHSISFKLNPRSTLYDDLHIVEKGISGQTPNYAVGIDANQRMFYKASTKILGGIFVENNEWTNCVFSYDINTTGITMYINGVLDLEDDTLLNSTNTGTFNIGVSLTHIDQNHFDGLIDEVAFWNRALTSGEALEISESGVPIHPSILQDSSGSFSLGSGHHLDIGSGIQLSYVMPSSIIQGLISYWPLNETGTSNRLDLWHGQNTLTGFNVNHTDGLKNFAARNDTNTGRLGIVQSAQSGLDISNELTLSCWVRATGSNDNVLMGKWGSAADSQSYRLHSIHNDGGVARVNFQIRATGGPPVSQALVGTKSCSGLFRHVAATYKFITDGTSQARLYIDGILDASDDTFEGPINTINGEFNFFTDSGTNSSFKGAIDEAAIWNRALSSGEIAWLSRRHNYGIFQSHSMNTSGAAFYQRIDFDEDYKLFDHSLVGYWNFDESGYLGKDLSTHGNDLSVLNEGSGVTYITSGITNGGARIDQTSNGSLTRSLSNIDDLYIQNEFTAACWIKTENPSGSLPMGIMSSSSGSSAALTQFNIQTSTNKFSTQIGVGAGFTTLTSDQSIEAGRWYHIAVTYDWSYPVSNPSLKLYINGKLEKHNVSAGFINYPTNPLFRIGDIFGSTNNFQGIIDEVCFYKRALAEIEIIRLYELTKPYPNKLQMQTRSHSNSGVFDSENWKPIGSGSNYVLNACESTGIWRTSDPTNFSVSLVSGINESGVRITAISGSAINDVVSFRIYTQPTGQIFGTASSGLVSYWKLDELSAPFNDYGSSGNHLGSSGVISSDIGMDGRSIYFSGSNKSYLSINDSNQSGLDTTSSLTIAAYIKPTGAAAVSRGIAGKFTTNGNRRSYLLFLSSTNRPFFLLSSNGTATTGVYYLSGVQSGYWQHVCGVFDDSTNIMSLYYNGNLVDSSGYPYSVNDSTAPFTVGAFSGTDDLQEFQGNIDEVAFWNRALTSGEVYQLANKNLSENNYLTFWSRSSRQGTFLELQLDSNDASGSTSIQHSKTFYISYDRINEWQEYFVDLSAYPTTISKNFTHVGIKCIDDSQAFTADFDEFKVVDYLPSGGFVTSPINNFISYRGIFTNMDR